MAALVLPLEFDVSPPTPANSLLTGVVRSTSGRAIPDVTIDVMPATFPLIPAVHTKTGPDGSFRIVVPSGNYIVRAQTQQQFVHPRGQTASSVVTYAKVESLPIVATEGTAVVVNLVIKPNALLFPVTVRVLDDLGRPVPGALVEWFGRRQTPRAFFGGTFRTDARGSLALGAIAAGPLTLIATSSQGDSHLGASLVAEVTGTAMDPITLRLRPASRVLGHVEFTDRPTPLHGDQGLEVWVQREGRGQGGSFPGPGLMNGDGTFSLGAVAGEGCLRVRGVPSAWRLREILHRGEDVHGRLLDFDSEEIYDLVVRIEPGIDDNASAHPTCVRTEELPVARR
jgi:hypothetical protein